MNTRREMSRLYAALLALAMIVGLASTLWGRFGANTSAHSLKPSLSSPPAANECEGDACTQITFTYDEAKGEYRAQNNSQERWARVTASNMAASASVCLAPGKSDSLAIKSVVGPYRAEYSEPRCGAPPAE